MPKCTWSLNTKEKCPHTTVRPAKPKILDNILQNIGNTPLVRLNKIPQSLGIECEVLVKCEFFNAGGSVKDRIGRRMVEDAEKSGRIKPGDVLIEPTSGNTGIGLALAAAIKGYRMIITLPEKMSQEKVDVLKALGAEIIRTPTEAAWDSPDSHISVAQRLNKEIPNSHILDQYINPGNPLAHYDETAEEIYEACDGKIDMLVAGAGTGGTISGIGRKLKEKIPGIKIVGVDPYGSILAQPESLNKSDITGYQVEGIGYDFIPDVLDRSVVDEWIKSEDKESFIMSRRMIKEEGLLCGGSCGTAMWAAMQACKGLKKGQRCVVVLPDSVRNYMSKFLNDGWMVEKGFMEAKDELSSEPWAKNTISDLKLQIPVTASENLTCGEAVDIMNEQGFDQLPVIDSQSNDILGVVSAGNLMSHLVSKKLRKDDPISKAIYKQFRKVALSTNLAELSRMFDKDHFALVVASQRCFSGDGNTSEKNVIVGVVTRIDLLNFIMEQ